MVKHILIFSVCIFFCIAGLKVIYCILFHWVGTFTLPENKMNLCTGAKILFLERNYFSLQNSIHPDFLFYFFICSNIVCSFSPLISDTGIVFWLVWSGTYTPCVVLMWLRGYILYMNITKIIALHISWFFFDLLKIIIIIISWFSSMKRWCFFSGNYE